MSPISLLPSPKLRSKFRLIAILFLLMELLWGLPLGVFIGLDVNRTSRGLPILSAALGHLECEPVSHVDSGDHRVFLAQVTGGAMRGEARPMVHLRRSGMRY